jgi:hypothetical protein
LAEDNQPIVQPLAIVGWRLGDNDQQQVLLQWQGLLPEDTSWEDLKAMRVTYPNPNLEDKVFFEEEGDVMDSTKDTPLQEPSDDDEWAEDFEEDQVDQIPLGRAKRVKSRPKYLNDFI